MGKGNKNKIVAIIPARMASTRFPGKPLAKILGLELIEHVRRRVGLCEGLSEVLVATCDKEIKETVEKYGGKAIMTSEKHERCTDRIAEAAREVEADVIVNVQGDEPMITPQAIIQLVEPFASDKNCRSTNLLSPIDSKEDLISPNVVKTVCDLDGNIMYFSREPIPSGKKFKGPVKAFRQFGVIAFKKDFLIAFSKLPQTPLERIESVDMLRAIEHGYKIKAVVTEEEIYGVDTPEDLLRVESIMKSDRLLSRYLK